MSLLEFSQTRLFDLEPCIIGVSCAHVNVHPSVQHLKKKDCQLLVSKPY